MMQTVSLSSEFMAMLMYDMGLFEDGSELSQLKNNPEFQFKEGETAQARMDRLCNDQPSGIPTVIDSSLPLIVPPIYQGVRVHSARTPRKSKLRELELNRIEKSKNRLSKLKKMWLEKNPKAKKSALSAFMSWVTFRPSWEIRNTWFSKRLRAQVTIYFNRKTLKCKFSLTKDDDHTNFKIGMYLNTYRASDVYDIEAEGRALKLLKTLVTEEQYLRYLLTGMLVEQSHKSKMWYIFRKLRPTIAFRKFVEIKENNEIEIKNKVEITEFVASLCLHTQGYYHMSWAGTLVPTDDVIMHILLMRSDEKLYWRKATQHDQYAPQADI